MNRQPVPQPQRRSMAQQLHPQAGLPAFQAKRGTSRKRGFLAKIAQGQ